MSAHKNERHNTLSKALRDNLRKRKKASHKITQNSNNKEDQADISRPTDASTKKDLG